jgi:hypothetical protein
MQRTSCAPRSDALRHTRALAWFLALAVQSANAAWGQTPVVQPRLELIAAIDPPTAKLGAPVIVKFILRNVFYRRVAVADNGPEMDYKLVVVDRSGKELKRTDLANRLYSGTYILLRTASFDLDLFEEIRAEIDVTKMYQVTQPGTYVVSAIRGGIYPDPGDDKNSGLEKAFSNPVRFKVVR